MAAGDTRSLTAGSFLVSVRRLHNSLPFRFHLGRNSTIGLLGWLPDCFRPNITPKRFCPIISPTMKTLFSKAGIVVCAAILMSAGMLFAGMEEDQPRMEAAISFLQEAKKAEDPVPSLDKALGELKKAKHNKAGWRVRAIQEVDAAIADANLGNKQAMESKCGAAIAAIHTGMSKAR